MWTYGLDGICGGTAFCVSSRSATIHKTSTPHQSLFPNDTNIPSLTRYNGLKIMLSLSSVKEHTLVKNTPLQDIILYSSMKNPSLLLAQQTNRIDLCLIVFVC